MFPEFVKDVQISFFICSSSFSLPVLPGYLFLNLFLTASIVSLLTFSIPLFGFVCSRLRLIYRFFRMALL